MHLSAKHGSLQQQMLISTALTAICFASSAPFGLRETAVLQLVDKYAQKSALASKAEEETLAKLLRADIALLKPMVNKAKDEAALAQLLHSDIQLLGSQVKKAKDEAALAQLLRSDIQLLGAKIKKAKDEAALAQLLRSDIALLGSQVKKAKDESAIGKLLRRFVAAAKGNKHVIMSLPELPWAVVGSAIDSFLAPRLGWCVLSEPYEWLPQLERKVHLSSECPQHVGMAPFFRWWQRKQNPAADACAAQRLIVMDALRSYWGTATEQAAVLGPRKDLYDHRTALALHTPASRCNTITSLFNCSWCPDGTDNLWQCFFLPLTNCSLPNTPPAKDTWVHYYQPAGAGAGGPRIEQETPFKDAKGFIDADPFSAVRNRTFDMQDLRAGKKCRTRPELEHSGMDMWAFKRFVLLRFSYQVRAEVYRRIRRFRKEHAWLEKDNVVGVHIRRGDKLKKVYEKSVNCSSKGSSDPRCSTNFEQSLSQYLVQAKGLLQASGGGDKVFIMSDDRPWLQAEAARDKSGLKLMLLGGMGEPGAPGTWTGKKEATDTDTEEALVFWTSIELMARCCGGVVGNMRSAVSRLAFGAACASRPAGSTCYARSFEGCG